MTGISSDSSPIWRDRAFLHLWIGTMISSFGDGAYFILLGWFVIATTGNELKLGSALICASIPRLVLMAFGGAVADRISRKAIMVASVSIRAAVLLVFAIVLLLDPRHQSMWEVYVMALCFGTVDAFFWPANSSVVPNVVHKDQLAVANSTISTTQQFSAVIGPLLAAGLLFLHRYWLMFGCVAVLFAAAGLILLGMRMRGRGEAGAQHTRVKPDSRLLADLIGGIRYVMRIRVLVLIMGASLLINLFIMGPINVGLPVLVKSLGWPGGVYGTFESAIGIGAIAGGVLVGVLKGLRGRLRWLGPIVSGIGIAFAPIGFSHSVLLSILLMAIVGFFMSLSNIPIITYIQTITEDRMLGRVMSLLSLTSLGLTPVSYALCSLVLERKWITDQDLLLIGGCVVAVLCASLILMRDFRRMEDHPLWAR